jgi:CubicO group peptidase (beta-lactamase class C family)
MAQVGARIHYPAFGNEWERKSPEDLGINAGRLKEAMEYATANETGLGRNLPEVHPKEPMIVDYPDNEIVGPLKERTGVNGVIVKDGYMAGEWGDIHRVDMTFSVAKSYLSTMAGLAYDHGLIKDVDRLVRDDIDDERFESEHNSKITWRMLLQQTSEWEGVLFDKRDIADRRKGIDRTLNEPGTFWEYNDVRVNLLGYALLKLWRRPLPVLLRDRIMDPIGATARWEWHGYNNSWGKGNGLWIQSVSGGGHWGGGVWASSLDHARFGQLFAAGGRWEDSEIISREWISMMTEPCPHNESCGFMWWVNQNRKLFPSAPPTSYFALGKGANIIWIDPDLKLTAVVRWINRDAYDGFVKLVLEALG